MTDFDWPAFLAERDEARRFRDFRAALQDFRDRLRTSLTTSTRENHMTTDYPAFLAARLDQLEFECNHPVGPGGRSRAGEGHHRWHMADIAAKRAILDDYEKLSKAATERRYSRNQYADSLFAQLHARHEDIVHLCRPFADHPDYKGQRQ